MRSGLRQSSPVCGSDNNTYPSECAVTNLACGVPGLKSCARATCPTTCTSNYIPVCGTNNQTYDSPCELRKAACGSDIPTLNVTYEGACRAAMPALQCKGGQGPCSSPVSSTTARALGMATVVLVLVAAV
ncbi:hypothetical protein ACHHYP_20705 [Achlya hypogyna]|uniref:Kazal-like domain-containing protein n=1 Tax=Achlya hypogyna TaxID=1202772 RepID=A0A1V9ZF85_ACHHY|nr:hypothetical protein ACHHYP_20705 [Achlya hypogyna]